MYIYANKLISKVNQLKPILKIKNNVGIKNLNKILLLTTLIQVSLLSFMSFSTVNSSNNQFIKLYSNWHSDTDLQILANAFQIPGAEKNKGLSLVDKENFEDKSNRFQINEENFKATAYFSSSGLNTIIGNLIFDQVKHWVSPSFFFYLIRVINIILTNVCFLYLFKALSIRIKHLSAFLIFFIMSPWIFLDSTSLFWSIPIRFAPIFYVCYLSANNRSYSKFRPLELFLICFFLIISTLNGFEYSSFVFLLVICLGLQLTSTAHIVDKFKYIILVIFAGVISILQWLFIVQINFKNWNSSISLIQYTLFKHSSFGGNAPVPLGGLASGDSSISFLQSLIRVVFKTSLLFPYDLIQNFTNGAGHLDFTLKSIVFFTSFGLTSMVVMFLLKRKISILLFISIFLIWIYSIKSYAYHHVHIIGTALIFYLIFCLLMIPKELMSDNRS